MKNLETQLKRLVRDRYNGGKHSWNVEFAKGGDSGFADTQLAMHRQLIPFEFKLCDIVGASIKLHKVRPAQFKYHFELKRAGIQSAFIAGKWCDKGWLAFLIDPLLITSPEPLIPISQVEMLDFWTEGFSDRLRRSIDLMRARTFAVVEKGE